MVHRLATRLFIAASVLSAFSASAIAFELEGYTEPFQTVNVAANESGTVEEVFVREGDTVTADQPIARLNNEVHLALLAIAEQNMNAQGRIDAANADLKMRILRLEKLRKLRADGHARQEEVDRAESEVEVARANLLTANEDHVARRLEYEKIKAEIDRRTIKAPLTGVVTTLHKDRGEFVAPNNPDVVTVVQLDKLLANFTLLRPQAAKLKVHQKIVVHLRDSNADAAGVVEYISPVNDAESGAVLVKIRIDNRKGAYRAGEHCTIRIGK